MDGEETQDAQIVDEVYVGDGLEAQGAYVGNGAYIVNSGGSPGAYAGDIGTAQRPGGVEITNPQDGDRFVLDPTIPPRYQQLELTVGAGEDISAVTWYVDGRPIATIDRKPFSTFWVLKEGSHFLKAVGLGAEKLVQSREVEVLITK